MAKVPKTALMPHSKVNTKVVTEDLKTEKEATSKTEIIKIMVKETTTTEEIMETVSKCADLTSKTTAHLTKETAKEVKADQTSQDPTKVVPRNKTVITTKRVTASMVCNVTSIIVTIAALGVTPVFATTVTTAATYISTVTSTLLEIANMAMTSARSSTETPVLLRTLEVSATSLSAKDSISTVLKLAAVWTILTLLTWDSRRPTMLDKVSREVISAKNAVVVNKVKSKSYLADISNSANLVF